MTTTRQDTPFPNLCQFQFVDGRYCGLPSQSSSGGFCRSHNDLNRRKPPVEEDLTGIMMSLTSESRLDLHTALEKVFLALAGNRISARRAATIGYLAQLILSSQQEAARKSQPAAGSKPLGKAKPGRPPTSVNPPQPIDESVIQDLLGKLREKFPAQRNPRDVPPGRNYNLRS